MASHENIWGPEKNSHLDPNPYRLDHNIRGGF